MAATWTHYRKIRELVKLADALEAEGRKMQKGGAARAARMGEAEGYRVKALWLAGRITDADYAAHQTEQLDARNAR